MHNAAFGPANAPEPRYFGLLHVDRANNYDVNLRKSGGTAAAKDPIDIYLRCAANCASSARAAGLNFAVITNQADFLSDRARLLGFEPPALVEHRFERVLPTGIPFYSAHFKLEVLAAFGSGKWGPISALVDLDTVFLKPLPMPRSDDQGLFVYDISAQVFPAFGTEKVAADLATVAGTVFNDPAWFGGEAIAGSNAAFARLANTIDLLWPRYLSNINNLHHIGDEMVVSAALNLHRANGEQLTDWGASGEVVRWWSARTLHRQPALRDAVRHCALLHLPADKEYLANYAMLPFHPQNFVSSLSRSVKSKILLQRAIKLLRVSRSQRHLYAPTV